MCRAPSKAEELDHSGLDAVGVVDRYRDLIRGYHGIIPDQDIMEFLNMINSAKAQFKMVREEFPNLIKEFAKAA